MRGCARIERPSFRYLPFVPFIPSRILLEECLECAEGACIVRRTSYMHHPPIVILLRESQPPSTLYLHSLFRINPFVLALIFLQFLLRAYARTISHPFVYSCTVIPVGSTVDGEKMEEMEIWREHDRKGVKRARGQIEGQGKREISRTKGEATAVCT